MFDQNILQTLLIYALPVLFAITVHEAAHGYIAKLFGDKTAYYLGRVSLNPLKHIDPVGTILIPILMYWATQGMFLFGYAKPVPVNFSQLRSSVAATLVALAGPASNFVQAMLWGVVSIFAILFIQEDFFIRMANAGIMVNLVMCMFNLFPIPPLDGGRVLISLLPAKAADYLARIEPYGFFIVMALVLLGVLSQFWLIPLVGLGYRFIQALVFQFVL